MGILDFFRTKKESNNSTAIFGFASKEAEAGKGLDQDQLQRFQDEFLSVLNTNDKQKATNYAANLMVKGAYRACIKAYQQLIEKYPEGRGTYEGQIGAAMYFLGDYEEAILYYLKARSHDAANADMMDDNIWEACETIYKEKGKLEAIKQYTLYCPQGKFLKEANRILFSNH